MIDYEIGEDVDLRLPTGKVVWKSDNGDSYAVECGGRVISVTVNELRKVSCDTPVGEGMEVMGKVPWHKMEAFTPVIVRDRSQCTWRMDFFETYRPDNEFPFKCMTSCYRYCLPFRDFRHLLGTTWWPAAEPRENEQGN